jgi:hypothetical protein
MARKHTILTALLLSSAPAIASPPPRTPPPDTQISKEMQSLRGELVRAGHDKARAEIGRFRALCDKDGYPLVGNLANKSINGKPAYQPSQFCADVRKTEKRS